MLCSQNTLCSKRKCWHVFPVGNKQPFPRFSTRHSGPPLSGHSLVCVTRKQTLRSLSLSWPRPSFFWYDTDFSEFDSADIIDYILENPLSYQKKDGCSHTTKTLKSVFTRRTSCGHSLCIQRRTIWVAISFLWRLYFHGSFIGQIGL